MHKANVRPLKLLLASLWGGLFLCAFIAWLKSGVALTAIPHLLEEWLNDFGLFNAALTYIIIYAIRPLILFPASLLTVASGLIFGPWLGTLFTIIGINASANFGFILSRWFGRQTVENHMSDLVKRWDQRLMDNGLVAVMTMRLIMLPLDAVNFGCGLTAVRHRDYALGTFLGILPSLIGFVLLGGTVAAGVENRAVVLTLSALFMIVGFAIAHALKRKE